MCNLCYKIALGSKKKSGATVSLKGHGVVKYDLLCRAHEIIISLSGQILSSRAYEIII